MSDGGRRFSRRGTLAQIAALGFVALTPRLTRASETTGYSYDSQGRVVRVQFEDGSTVVYSYDAAGNRTQVARTSTPPSTTFTRTLALSGAGTVNLRTVANAAGYNGAQDADVAFTVAPGVTITGLGGEGGGPGTPGVDTGVWPITQFYIALSVSISGTVNGGGGGGGYGNSGPGGLGGDAIHCRAPVSVTVNAGGIVRAGGGGGGGGLLSGPPLFRFGGGGGGGGAPNGWGGDGGEGESLSGRIGQNGSAGGGGAGGVGGGAGATAGGSGGGYATAGSTGVAGGGLGGPAGYAIRENGFAVVVVNAGTIVGAVG